MKNSLWTSFEKTSPHVMQILRSAKQCGRMPHAYLVCSSDAKARMDFPLLIFALMTCENPSGGNPCGECPVCRKILNGTYPDLFSLEPISKSRKIQIGEDSDEPDTMRWFEALFHLGGMTASGWKFGIIRDAECLTAQAQNAFLKTLEEPPEKCAFVLTTSNPSELLPTIRSRCQTLRLTDAACVYDFPGAAKLPEILTKLLFECKDSLPAAGECASALLNIAEALAGAAEKTVAKKWKPRLEAAENLESAGLKLLEKRIKGEESCEYLRLRDDFMSAIHTFFAQAVLVSSGGTVEMLPNKELFAPPFPMNRLAEVSMDSLCAMLDHAENLLRAMRTNANDDLAIRSFCLNIAFKS